MGWGTNNSTWNIPPDPPSDGGGTPESGAVMALNPACRTYLPMLSPFIDGELSVPERQAVERHCAACKDCTARVADLRAESGLLRLGMEMLADEADFTGFSQKVMARITPERPPLWERVRVSLGELFLYQRGAMVTAMAACAVAALAVVVVSQLGKTPEGYAGDQVMVQQVSIGDNAALKPVVTTTDTGNTIIWLVDQPDASTSQPGAGGAGAVQDIGSAKKQDGQQPQKDEDEEEEEEIGGPNRGGALPRGGNL